MGTIKNIRLVASPAYLPEGVRATLNELDRACFPDCQPYPKSGCYWWLAYSEEGEPVGFCGLQVYSNKRTMAFLCRAGIVAGFRGSGVQRKLVRLRERKAKQLGLKRLVTYTHPKNFASAANLIKCGFRFYEPPTLWGLSNGLYFEKTIG